MSKKLDGKSQDITQANLEELKRIFPEVFCENKIDFEKLQVILGYSIEKDNEKYSFNWKGKFEAIKLAQLQSTGTLLPCKAESKNWDTTQNLYIEGDNLEVLKLLQKSYKNSIKMIYIDPPYNTGKDFVYKDNFDDNIANYKNATQQASTSNAETTGRFHRNWLNMMLPRLKLARSLLTPDGLIFISIDDNEIANLKQLCNTEVFGEDNFIGQITIVGNPRGRDYGGVARMNDYLLVYSKTEDYEINLVDDKENQFTMEDEHGGYELRELRNRNIKFNKENRPNLYYPFYINPDSKDDNGLYEISLEKMAGWIELYPLKSQGIDTVWRWGKPKSQENLNKNIKAKPMKNGSYQIVEKYREARRMARSVWWDKDTNTEKGTLLLKELFKSKVFDYPKPMEMIYKIVQMGTTFDAEDIVLDFFSGSATMAHAVMKINADDGGNRKFICVQLPENLEENLKSTKSKEEKLILQNAVNFCKQHDMPCFLTELGKERIRRAGEKIKEINPMLTPNLDIGFKVFKLDTSNLIKWNNTPTTDVKEIQERIQKSLFYLEPDRKDIDVVYEIMLKFGLPLTMSISQKAYGKTETYIVEDPQYKLLICLQPNIDLSEVEKMANDDIGVYVFADRCFADANILINTEEILKKKDKKMRLF